jgi:L-rhamnose mutarotase
MKKWMNIEYLKKVCSQIKSIRIKTWYEYTDEIIKSINKKEETVKKNSTIYYYVHHTSSSNIRTGIQNYTIYLAKQFVKKKYK